MLFFFSRGVLDEILNLIESVSEGFPSYFVIKLVDVFKVVGLFVAWSFGVQLVIFYGSGFLVVLFYTIGIVGCHNTSPTHHSLIRDSFVSYVDSLMG